MRHGILKSLSLLFLLALVLVSPAPASSQELVRAPEISGQTWINVKEDRHVSIKALRGKVILLVFWTLSDTNCENALLNLNAWYKKYKARGLEIIGVCTPEWIFDSWHSQFVEKVLGLGVKFPNVFDQASQNRHAYGLLPWPAFFLVDRQGYLRAKYHRDFDNFTYSQMETMLGQLLEERGVHRVTRRVLESEKLI
ncbi:MAG: redoxin domain-containing protein [Candidatus Omnitrophota bacterium]